MRSINNFSSKTGKVFLYSSDVIFKNYKSYLYTLLLPLVITLIVFMYQASSVDTLRNILNNYNFPLLFLIPSMVLIFFFSTILLDWRKSTFIKQMTNFGVNKYSFILGFTLTTFICSIASTAVGFLYIYLFSFIPTKAGNPFEDWAKYIDSGMQIFGLIIAIIFSSLMTSFVAFLFTGWLKNIYVIQTFNVVLVAFFLVFSDILIPPEYTSRYEPLCIISYFDPYKYVSWIALMFNSKMNVNFYYAFYFIFGLDDYVSFDKIWQPIVGSIGYIIIFAGLSTWLFSASTKK